MNATGNWTLVVKTPMGQQKIGVQLTEEAGTLTGIMDDEQNPAGPILDAKVDGAQLTWKFPIKKPFTAKLAFALKLEGEQLTGTCKAGVFPAASVTGTRA